ncbi:MAG: hydrogenase maturation protease [Mycolicibacterium sp.]|nr:hydrogenase maturation protease [Mycolicibacterium sp.]
MGNHYRRDDGVGLAVAAVLAAEAGPGVRIVTDVGDPCRVLDAWDGAPLAVVVDAAIVAPSVPGRIHRCTVDRLRSTPTTSSHGMDLATVLALGEVLDRVPGTLVLFAIEVADIRDGVGLSPEVAAVVPQVATAVLEEVKTQGRQGR